jgi:predicted class III extradiol MEMO1 family dioxygenase
MELAKETMTVLEAKNVVMFKLQNTVLNLDADFPELIITSNDITHYLLHNLNYLLSVCLVKINVINGSY